MPFTGCFVNNESTSQLVCSFCISFSRKPFSFWSSVGVLYPKKGFRPIYTYIFKYTYVYITKTQVQVGHTSKVSFTAWFEEYKNHRETAMKSKGIITSPDHFQILYYRKHFLETILGTNIFSNFFFFFVKNFLS